MGKERDKKWEKSEATALPDKPFFAVPPVSEVEIERGRKKITSHDTFNGLTGKISFTVSTLTPIHVGSGDIALASDGKAYLPFYKKGEKYTIPGSSLKGVIRSVAEAISYSCDPFRGDKCDAIKPDTPALCPACSTFGAMGYQGRISISDAILVKGETKIVNIPVLWPPRNELKGRKFYIHGKPAEGEVETEVINQNATFEFVLTFQNLADWELGLIFLAMGLDNTFHLKLGGAKPRCYGSIRFLPKEGYLRKDNNPFIRLINKEESEFKNREKIDKISNLSDFVKENIKSYPQDKFSEQLEKLGEQMKFTSALECPKGNY